MPRTQGVKRRALACKTGGGLDASIGGMVASPRLQGKAAVITGGESGDPKSPHFNDQALRYARGELRPVYFYPSDLAGHIERDYHPGA